MVNISIKFNETVQNFCWEYNIYIFKYQNVGFTDQVHGNELVRSQQSLDYSRNSPSLAETKGSLLCSQGSTIGSCTYTDDSIPNIMPSFHFILSLKVIITLLLHLHVGP
jgi:hypothetical protein